MSGRLWRETGCPGQRPQAVGRNHAAAALSRRLDRERPMAEMFEWGDESVLPVEAKTRTTVEF